MSDQDFELLRALCENSAFPSMLKAMIDESRAVEMSGIEASHVGQNPSTAAMIFGRLAFLEDLPDWFQSVLREQKRKRKFAE